MTTTDDAPSTTPETVGLARRLGEYRQLPLLLVIALLAFAYEDLLDFSPYRSRAGDAQGLEGALFVPRSVSWWFVVTVFCWKLIEERGRILSAFVNPGRWGLAGLPFALCFALFGWGIWTGAHAFLIPSLSLFMIAGALAAGGLAAARTVLAPAAILLFAVPPPAALMNQGVFAFQIATSQLASGIAGLFVTISRSADLIFANDQVFQVIESCSGLAIISTLTVSSFIIPSAAPRRRLHAFLLISAAPLVGLIANIARVLTIMGNPLSDINAIHTAQGIAMLVGGVLALAAIDRQMTRWLGPGTSEPIRMRKGLSESRRTFFALAGVALTLGIFGHVMPSFEAERLQQQPFRELRKLEGFRGQANKVDTQYLGTTHFTQSSEMRYEVEGEAVDLFIGVNNRDVRYASAQSPKTALPGRGFEVLSRETVQRPTGRQLERLVVQGPAPAERRARRYLVHHFSLGMLPIWNEALRESLALDSTAARRTDRQIVVRLTTPLASPEPSQEEIERAATRFEALEARVEENLSREGPRET